MSLQAINPATGERVREYDEMSSDEIRKGIAAVHEAFLSWRETSFAERGEVLRQAAGGLRDGREALSRIMAAEMGKVLREGEAEVLKCAGVCEFYAEHAEAFLAPEPVLTDATDSFVAYEPLGVVLAIMPWNFPLWQVFRFAAPGIMAGNAGLLKHASNVPGCALAIERIFREAGLPDNVFKTLLIGSAKVEEAIRHPHVRAVTLTGSTPAGRAVAGLCGSLLKKTVLELGGSDPYIILEDAVLDAAVEACAISRLINGGQSCIAAKRFVVVDAVRDAFTEKFVERMKKVRMGDPLLPKTDLGPQARRDLRDELHGQVERSMAAGARLLLGGEIPTGPGAYYPPTVLAEVRPGMPAYDEELFGPVAAILPARDEDDAVRIANDTCFGLGAAVFTADAVRGEEIARRRLQAGCCFVNAFVRSDARLPFGGIKESGYGRELGCHGIREFVNIKTVYVG